MGYGELPLSLNGSGNSVADPVDVSGSPEIAMDGGGYMYALYSYPSQQGSQIVGRFSPNAVGSATPYHSWALTAQPEGPYLGVAPDSQGNVFVSTADSIYELAPNAGVAGFPTSSTPVNYKATISGSNTQLDVPNQFVVDNTDLATDANGTVYVGNFGEITEYAAGTNGNAPPSKIVANTAGGLLHVIDAKVDTAGNLYVAYMYDNLSELNPMSAAGPSAIVEYAHGSYHTPLRVISGPATQLNTIMGGGVADPVAIAIDPTGDVYALVTGISNGSQTAVVEFAAGASGNVAPTMSFIVPFSTFTIGSAASGDVTLPAPGQGTTPPQGVYFYHNGSQTGQLTSSPIGTVFAIAYDAGGNLYVSSTQNAASGNFILEYPPNPTAMSTPTSAIPAVNDYFALAVDATGDVFGNSYFFRGGSAASYGSLDEYAPHSTSGSLLHTFESQGPGLGVDPTGNVYVSQAEAYGPGFVFVYSPGSSGSLVPPASSYWDLSASTLIASVAVDSSLNLYVASCTTSSISVYAPGATAAMPTRSIIGPNTQLDCPTSIAVDGNQNIYVVNSVVNASSQAILVFAAGQSGNVAPAHVATFANGLPFLGITIGPKFGAEPSPSLKRRVAPERR